MSGVFQNIDPPPPPPPPSECVCTHTPLVQGEDILAGWRGRWGVNILEDASHSSVLYICKYFVIHTLSSLLFSPSTLQWVTWNTATSNTILATAAVDNAEFCPTAAAGWTLPVVCGTIILFNRLQ
jgi:hypothetical protein